MISVISVRIQSVFIPSYERERETERERERDVSNEWSRGGYDVHFGKAGDGEEVRDACGPFGRGEGGGPKSRRRWVHVMASPPTGKRP